jgi:hypothetical protein
MFKGIILHWTAGNYTPCDTDILHYHYIIDGSGKVFTGRYSPDDNLNCIDNKYAAHCGGGNTGRIGISICCRKNKNTPPTKVQIEAMCKKAAECCIKYNISPSKVQTHAEFGITHPKTTSFGKIDINSIPYDNINGIEECGSYLRKKVLWYYIKLKEK